MERYDLSQNLCLGICTCLSTIPLKRCRKLFTNQLCIINNDSDSLPPKQDPARKHTRLAPPFGPQEVQYSSKAKGDDSVSEDSAIPKSTSSQFAVDRRTLSGERRDSISRPTTPREVIFSLWRVGARIGAGVDIICVRHPRITTPHIVMARSSQG